MSTSWDVGLYSNGTAGGASGYWQNWRKVDWKDWSPPEGKKIEGGVHSRATTTSLVNDHEDINNLNTSKKQCESKNIKIKAFDKLVTAAERIAWTIGDSCKQSIHHTSNQMSHRTMTHRQLSWARPSNYIIDSSLLLAVEWAIWAAPNQQEK